MLFLRQEEGQGLVEYALILVLVAVAIIVALALVGPSLGNLYSQVAPCIAPPMANYCM